MSSLLVGWETGFKIQSGSSPEFQPLLGTGKRTSVRGTQGGLTSALTSPTHCASTLCVSRLHWAPASLPGQGSRGLCSRSPLFPMPALSPLACPHILVVNQPYSSPALNSLCPHTSGLVSPRFPLTRTCLLIQTASA